MGYIGIAIENESPWAELVAVAFGVGMGLTLDEFALWLNLEDVYWTEKGRQSIDAVVVTVCLLAISLLGLPFWIDVYQALLVLLGVGGAHLSGGETAFVLVPIQLAGACLAVVCLVKGKLMTGAVGLFVPLVALVGALRPAKPGSPWGRRRPLAT
jgi:hypothetical protein